MLLENVGALYKGCLFFIVIKMNKPLCLSFFSNYDLNACLLILYIFKVILIIQTERVQERMNV